MSEIGMLNPAVDERMKVHGGTREGSGSSRKEDVIVNTQVSWRRNKMSSDQDIFRLGR